MSLWKRILDSRAGVSLLAGLIAVYIRLVHATTRWTVIGAEGPERLWHGGRPFIGCFWHGRMLPMRYCWPRTTPIAILISAHRDGRLIAAVMAKLGVGTVVGSKSRGGAAAVIGMRSRLREGISIGITPDGPRGPRMRVAPGIIQLAAMTRTPIIPASYSTSRCKVFRSWDRFMLALPFGRGIYIFGDALEVPERPDRATVEALRLELENRLNAITADADRRCGRPAVEPAEPAHAGFAAPEPAKARAAGGTMTTGLALAAYRTLTKLGAPVIDRYLDRRTEQGKEDPARAAERRGIAARDRPAGALVWVHAASVGESLSVLPLINRIMAERAQPTVLLTTGTVTSAALMAERLPPGAIHQYVPVDRLPWVTRFLDHWRPDLALWVESELWPNLVSAAQRRAIPMVLVNGRMSDRSFQQWRRLPGLIRPLLSGFDLCLGQTDADTDRFRALGATRAENAGNLKFAAPPLPANPAAVDALAATWGGRPRWIAASTHPGEDAQIADAHRHLRRTYPDMLTVLVPRHATRGAEVAELLAARGLAVARRSAGETATAQTDIYLVDTMGELGLIYNTAEVVFVGGSLVPHGGQNLLEPARLGCAILHGPHMDNFLPIVKAMQRAGATAQVSGGADLSVAVAALLDQRALREARMRAAGEVAHAQSGVLDAVVATLAPWLDALPSTAPSDPPAKHHARA